MKVRLGFVSNSSSSSFMCSICGEIESGMDASPGDFDMKRCEQDHYFHNDCSKLKEVSFESKVSSVVNHIENYKYYRGNEKETDLKKLDDIVARRDESSLDDMIHEMFDDGTAECFCPICSFVQIDSSDAVRYLYKKLGVTEKQLAKEIKDKFDSYQDFKDFIK